MHQRAALQRTGARCERLAGADAVAFVVGGVGRPQEIVGERLRAARMCAAKRAAGSAAAGAEPMPRFRQDSILKPRIAFHHAIRRRHVLHMQPGGLEAFYDQIVPRQLAQHVAIAGHAAGDDQAIGRARHRHIEQPAIFVLGLAEHGRARGRDRGRILGLLAGPDHNAGRMRRGVALRQPNEFQARGIGGRCRGVDQKHHRRFQPLGAMHGHDADFVARDFHVALDFGIGRAQPRHETLQRCRGLALVSSASSRNSSIASLASCPSRRRMRARPPSPPSSHA